MRAVLFDADGVVQQNPPGWEQELRRHGDGFVDDLFAAELPAMVGQRDFGDVLDEAVRRWRLPVAGEDLLGHWRRIEVVAGTIALARELGAAGVGCYLASNQHAYRASYMRGTLGYDDVFDRQFYSCELGVTKSSPKFFELVLDRLGLPAEEVLLVDDASSYVEAARSVGLRAVQWSVADGMAELRRLLGVEGLPV